MAASPDDNYLGIQQVAQKTGLAASAIRYYDQQFEEYLGVERGPGRRRRFSPKSVQRLMEVHRLLKEKGLSVRQVRQTISGNPPLGAAGAAGAAGQQEIAELKKEVEALKKQVHELADIQRRTLALVDGLTG